MKMRIDNVHLLAQMAIRSRFRIGHLLGALLGIALGSATLHAQAFGLGTIAVGAAAGLPDNPATFPVSSAFGPPVPFRVSGMPGVNSTHHGTGYFAIAEPTAPVSAWRGIVVCFTGSGGETWWAGGGQASQALINVLTADLRAEGFAVVQVRWIANWHKAKRNDRAGVARLACKPATIINYLHGAYYEQYDNRPLSERTAGEAGFCLTGNSGGASQVSYALSHYGLEGIVDVLIPTGGPVHADMATSILAQPEITNPYWLEDYAVESFDQGFGFNDGSGPALARDGNRLDENGVRWEVRWDQASIGTGGSDYYHPTTRIEFILGELDGATGARMIPTYKGYANTLVAAGQPAAFFRDPDPNYIPGTGHNTLGTQAGVDAFWDAVTREMPDNSAPVLSAPPNGGSTTDTTPTFQWQSFPSAATYRLQVDNNPDFASLAVNKGNLSSTSHTIPSSQALAPGTYYWRVRATDAGGVNSPWSAVWTVVIAP